MTYVIRWKRNKQIYTEYLNLKQLTECLEFIENHDDYELIDIVEEKS